MRQGSFHPTQTIGGLPHHLVSPLEARKLLAAIH